MPQKLPEDVFNWAEIHFSLVRISQKFTIKIARKDIFLNSIFNFQEILINFIMIYHFHYKEC